LVQGPYVCQFEEKWSAFTGAKHSIAVTSCTTGLHLSLVALGIEPRDEVIVPAFTWIATANVVEHLQAKVVFCDIDLETFKLDVQKLEEAITPRTRAIIPVHLFGMPAKMQEILAIAHKYQLKVVEDAACGFGSHYQAQHVGTLGETGVFSFHPRKAITTGEGGMITTQNDQLATKLRRLRDHGAAITDLQRHQGPKPYLLADHPEAGYNQRMTDLQAALGSAQMDRAPEIVNERYRLATRYDLALSNLSWLQIPAQVVGSRHGYQSYPCLFLPEIVKLAAKNRDVDQIKKIGESRNAWMDRLQQAGISTRPATHAVHMLAYYRHKYLHQPEDFPFAFAANDCSISLPLFHGLTIAEQDYVIDQVRGSNL
jgi:perosamine synthetase